MKLTEKAIKNLEVPAKQKDIADSETRGLYLRCHPSGNKIWRFRYQFRGKKRILKIGAWPDKSAVEARADAAEAKRQAKTGVDPVAEAQRAEAARRQMPTVAEFLPEYIERYAKPRKKSWRADEQILTRWVLPDIGLLPMNEVTRRDVVDILDKCRDAGMTRQPGKVLAAARMLFKVAIKRGILKTTPCLYIEEPQPEPTQRAMSEPQIRHWWSATGEALESSEPIIHKPVALGLRVLLLTGQRPGEVAAMHADELHLDSEFGPYWLIPAERRKKGRAKTGKPHAVALEPEAVAAIRQALEYSNGKSVFEKPSGGPIRTDTHMSKALARLFPDGHPTPHAARHTVATEMDEMHFDEYHVGQVLGHGSKTVTGKVYINQRVNKQALRKQRTLLAAWERRLLEIVDGEPGASKVVPIGARL